jgi:hypothetical protein
LKVNLHTCLAVLLAEILLFVPAGSSFAAKFPKTPSNLIELDHELRKSYLTLFRISPSLRFTPDQISQMRNLLQQGESFSVSALKHRSNQYSSELNHTESHLRKAYATVTADQRQKAHCSIQNLCYEQARTNVLAQHAIPKEHQR